MGVSSSIQFRGIEPVLQAYSDRDVEAWSLWQGKQFLTKGIGSDPLNQFLGILHESRSQAIYTLKVYEDFTTADDLKKIKSNTADDGSFNFRLNEPNENGMLYTSGTGNGYPNGNYSLLKRFEALEDKIGALLDPGEEEEPEEEKPDLMGAVIGLLQNPDKLEKIINLGKTIFAPQDQSAFVGANVHRIGTAIGNNNPSASLSPSSQPLDEAQLKRLYTAVEVLTNCDPKAVEHLEKLASIATQQPRQFTQLISMLDVF